MQNALSIHMHRHILCHSLQGGGGGGDGGRGSDWSGRGGEGGYDRMEVLWSDGSVMIVGM